MLLRQDRAPTAIAVVLEVAFRQAGGPVSGGEIAERTTAAARHRAVVQTLSRHAYARRRRARRSTSRSDRARMQPKRVLIAGGGIAGLTTALALLARGIDVQVFERGAASPEVGAGVELSPNATRVLIALGLGPALERIVWNTAGKEIRLWNTGQSWPMDDAGIGSVARARRAVLDGPSCRPSRRSAGCGARTDAGGGIPRGTLHRA